MSPIIHAEMGWLCGAQLQRKRDRVLVALAGVAPDLDGLGIVFGQEWFAAWHHRLGHGLIAAAVVVVVGLIWTRSAKVSALMLASFHLHVGADLVGSGPGWPIFYGWPFTDAGWLPSWQWDLASWQNAVIGMAITFTALGCALWLGRTPAELLGERVDSKVVEAIRMRFRPA